MMISKILIIVGGVIAAFGINSEAVKTTSNEKHKFLTPTQMRHLRKLLHASSREYKGNTSSSRARSNGEFTSVSKGKSLDNKLFPYHEYESNRRKPVLDISEGGSNTGVMNIFPQIRISSSDNDIPETFNYDSRSNEDDFKIPKNRPSHNHKRRTARSAGVIKGKAPLLTNKTLRKINRDPDLASTGAQSPSEETEETNLENTFGSNKDDAPFLPTVSESITTVPANNGGIPKIEINLSFGCLFFCE